MESEGALLARFRGTQRWYVASQRELVHKLKLQLVGHLDDGAIHRVPEGQPDERVPRASIASQVRLTMDVSTRSGLG